MKNYLQHFKSVLLLGVLVCLSATGFAQWNTWCYQDFTTTGQTTFTLPANCDGIVVEAIGGGGAGGAASIDGGILSFHFASAGGGGGAAYARQNSHQSTNMAGQNLTIYVGKGGTCSTNGTVTNGEASWVKYGETTLVSAVGGYTAAGSFNRYTNPVETRPGAQGGQASACIGSTCFSGGNGSVGADTRAGSGGSNGNRIRGGAGGGAAGGNGNGGNGSINIAEENESQPTGGVGGAGSASGLISGANWLSGGAGANGTYGSNGWESENVGNPYGGGGAGTRVQETGYNNSHNGSPGASGIVRVWFHIVKNDVQLAVNPASASVCSGSPLTLQASSSNRMGSASYAWSTGASGASINVNPTSNTTYTVTLTDTYATNCVARLSKSVAVTVNPAISAGAIATTGQSICEDAAAAEIANATEPTSCNGTIIYKWQVTTDGSTWLDADGTNNAATYTPTATYTGTPAVYTFRRLVNDGTANWETSTGTYTLTVVEAIAANDDVYARNVGTEELTLDVLGNDAAPATVEVIVATAPTHGTVTWNTTTKKFDYEADDDNEDDSFEYTISNGVCEATAMVTIKVSELQLGCAQQGTGNCFSFPDVTFTGVARTIQVNYTEDPENCDITLPTLPTGWESEPTKDGDNNVAWFVSVPETATSAEVEAFIGGIIFCVPTSSIKDVSVLVDGSNTPARVFYSSETQHYYQYVQFADTANHTATNPDFNKTWMDCYEAAQSMTYLGRQGYLATLTSLEEDKYVTRTIQAPAWVGATRLGHNAEEGTMYYASFNAADEETPSNHPFWYWACGPERGTTLLNVVSYPSGQSSTSLYESQGVYSNWAVHEPSSKPDGQGSSYESCLTILRIEGTYTGWQAHTPNFAWNDKAYDVNYVNTPSQWSSQGFLVEFGDQPVGNSTPDEFTFAVQANGKVGAFNPGELAGGDTIFVGETPEVVAATTEAEGLQEPLSYKWYCNDVEISGATNATYDPASYAATAGTYVFTREVKDGCSTTYTETEGSYTLKVEVPFVLNDIEGETVICNGESTQLTASSSSTVDTIEYLWNTGATTASITVTEAGTYTVTATGKIGTNSATDTKSVTVSTNALPSFTISMTPETCQGHDGVAKVSLDGATYLWSNGKTAQQLDTLTSLVNDGLYTVTVTGANGCSQTASVTITLNNTLEMEDVTGPVVCPGTEFTIFPEDVPEGTTYSWPAPDPINGISGLEGLSNQPSIHGVLSIDGDVITTPTLVSYSVTPQNGICTGNAVGVTVTVTTTVNPGVTITIPQTMKVCPGSDIEIPAEFINSVSTHDVKWVLKGTNDTVKHSGVTAVKDTLRLTLPTTCKAEYAYLVYYDDASGCIANDGCVVTVNSGTWSIDNTVYPNGSAEVQCLTAVTEPSAPLGTEILDSCGNATTRELYSVVPDPASISCEGTVVYTYRYTACDETYNDWTYTYTIKRTTAPTQDGGPVKTKDTVECLTEATPPALPIVKDACGNTLTAPTPDVDDDITDGEGTRTYTYTYKDCVDSSYVWTFTYTIDRTIAPIVNATDIESETTVSCLSFALPPTTIPSATSACGENLTGELTNTVDVPNALGCGGTRTYTYTYTDEAGLYSTWDYVYTITAPEAPEQIGIWPSNITNANSCYDGRQEFPTNAEVKALYLASCDNELTVSSEDIDVTNDDCGWSVTRKYTITDGCNTIYNSITYSGSDQTAPTYTRPENYTVYKDADCLADTSIMAAGEPTNITDCGEFVTVSYRDEAKDTVCEGSYSFNRVWRVVDACGNVSTSDSIQVITVLDNTKPTFTRPDDYIAYKDENCLADTSVSVAGEPTDVADNCTAKPVVTYRDEEMVSDCEGSYYFNRIWRVVDACGNVSESDSIQLITVLDNTKPTFVLPKDTTLCRTEDGEIFAPTTITGEPTDVADNCTTTPTVSWTDLDTTGTDLELRVIHRQWTVSDACGNDSVKVQNISIRPSLIIPGAVEVTCPDDLSIVLRYGAADTLADVPAPVVVNNMTDAELTITRVPAVGYRFPVGTTVVTWTIADDNDCEFTKTCTQNVVVALPPCGTPDDSARIDGYAYSSVRIGYQCWTGENLRHTHYADNTAVDPAGYANYDNDPANDEKFGKLYSWYAAMHLPEGGVPSEPVRLRGNTRADGDLLGVPEHTQGICPDGWAIPTAEDYSIMVATSGGADYTRTPDPQYWVASHVGTMPASGISFLARGAGYWDSTTSTFTMLLLNTGFWTNETETGSSSATCVELGDICNSETYVSRPKDWKVSVRCIKIQ